MFEIIQSETFQGWLSSLKDRRAGGDKRTQDTDIDQAIKIAQDWRD